MKKRVFGNMADNSNERRVVAMKSLYNKADIEISRFDVKDVILTSEENPIPDKPEPDPNDDV